MRWTVALIAGILFLGAVLFLLWVPPFRYPQMETVRLSLDEAVAGWEASGALAREDGYVYTVDIAQLMILLAARGERARFERLAKEAEGLVRDRRDDPYTRGFVAWRLGMSDQAPDASGTTEALRLAEALWRGAARFERPEWRQRAVMIVEGYCRHGYVERGVWLIRNYFNFETRAFANDSFLVDYGPDLLAEVATAADEDLRLSPDEPAAVLAARRALIWETATRSYALVRQAQGPHGLFYSMVQPDIGTLIPELDLTFFAPNGVVQVNNSCVIAESVAQGDPETARRTLQFALGRLRGLRRHYNVITGAAVGQREAGITTLTCLARLAARLGDQIAARRIARRALWHWEAAVEHGIYRPRLYTAGEVLFTIEALTERWPAQGVLK